MSMLSITILPVGKKKENKIYTEEKDLFFLFHFVNYLNCTFEHVHHAEESQGERRFAAAGSATDSHLKTFKQFHRFTHQSCDFIKNPSQPGFFFKFLVSWMLLPSDRGSLVR